MYASVVCCVYVHICIRIYIGFYGYTYFEYVFQIQLVELAPPNWQSIGDY